MATMALPFKIETCNENSWIVTVGLLSVEGFPTGLVVLIERSKGQQNRPNG